MKFAVIANQRARWCGNLLLFRGFPRQFANWLGMTFFLNFMALTLCLPIFIEKIGDFYKKDIDFLAKTRKIYVNCIPALSRVVEGTAR